MALRSYGTSEKNLDCGNIVSLKTNLNSASLENLCTCNHYFWNLFSSTRKSHLKNDYKTLFNVCLYKRELMLFLKIKFRGIEAKDKQLKNFMEIVILVKSLR